MPITFRITHRIENQFRQLQMDESVSLALAFLAHNNRRRRAQTDDALAEGEMSWRRRSTGRVSKKEIAAQNVTLGLWSSFFLPQFFHPHARFNKIEASRLGAAPHLGKA